MGSEFGPLANIMAIVAALIAVFATLVLKAIGPLRQWTSLIDDAPSFLVGAGPRVAAIALIAATYLVIDSSNYGWFLLGAGALGLVAFILISKFDLFRRAHTCEVPLLDKKGNQAVDKKGRRLSRHVAIGSEKDMRPQAKKAYEKTPGGLCKFMSGFGGNSVNNPAAIWEEQILARIANKMIVLLMSVILCTTTGLFIAAAAIDASQRPASTSSNEPR